MVIIAATALPVAAQTLTPFAAPPKDATSTVAAKQLVHVLVFLDGAIKGAADSKDGTDAATGALGLAFRSPMSSFFAQMTVAAKADSVSGRFGSALLTPGIGSPLSSGLIEWRQSLQGIIPDKRWLRWAGKDRLWFRGYGTISDSRWTLPAVPATATEGALTAVTVGMVPTGYGVGITYKVGEADLDGKVTAISIDAGFTSRLLNGDGSNQEFDRQRVAAVGSADRVFNGFELGLNLQYGQIAGGLTFYSFPNARSVAGLSRGQVLAGFSLKADLISKWTTASTDRDESTSPGK